MKKLTIIAIALIFILEGTGNCLRVPIDSNSRVAAAIAHFIDLNKVKDWDLVANSEKVPLEFVKSSSGIRGIFGKK